MMRKLGCSNSRSALLPRTSLYILQLFKVILIVSVSCVWAEDSAPAAPEDRWWENNSIAEDTRFHAALTASYTDATGNLKSTTKTAAAEIVVRKHRWSNYFYYTLMDQNITLSAGRGTVEQKRTALINIIRFMVLDSAYLSVGYQQQRDDPAFIAKARTIYGGVGTSIQPNAQHSLSILAAYGIEDKKFVDTSALTGQSAVPDQDGLDGVYVNESYTWVITRMLIFSQSGEMLRYFNSDFGKRWKFNVGLDVLLAPHLFLNLSFTRTFNENPAQQASGAKARDDLKVIGLKLTY